MFTPLIQSGSTTAALVQLFHTVTELLNEDPYVSVIALDFSKAFDMVRHVTLLQKLASLDIPDCVYNWLVDYFLVILIVLPSMVTYLPCWIYQPALSKAQLLDQCHTLSMP